MRALARLANAKATSGRSERASARILAVVKMSQPGPKRAVSKGTPAALSSARWIGLSRSTACASRPARLKAAASETKNASAPPILPPPSAIRTRKAMARDVAESLFGQKYRSCLRRRQALTHRHASRHSRRPLGHLRHGTGEPRLPAGFDQQRHRRL